MFARTMQTAASHAPPWGFTFPSTRAVVKWKAQLRQVKCTHSRFFGSPIRSKTPLQKSHRFARNGCTAELLQDAPFVIAIGACILSSLVLTKQDNEELESSKDASLGGDDVRNGAITIISFIPLFNWLGWVFAWLDANEQRYLFYASVYLAPYVKTGFSLTSDENWLLVLSYMACLAHVQLEVNLQSGGLEFGKSFFQDSLRQLQKKGRSELPGNQSRNFRESVSPDNEDVHMPPEEDFSRIELSEFDKKLSGMKKAGEDTEKPVVQKLEDAERGKRSADDSD